MCAEKTFGQQKYGLSQSIPVFKEKETHVKKSHHLFGVISYYRIVAKVKINLDKMPAIRCGL